MNMYNFIPENTSKFDFEKPVGMNTEINSYLITLNHRS